MTPLVQTRHFDRIVDFAALQWMILRSFFLLRCPRCSLIYDCEQRDRVRVAFSFSAQTRNNSASDSSEGSC